METEMKRGRSQVIRRFTPEASFRYQESGAWCLGVSVTTRERGQLDGALLDAFSSALRRWNAIGPTSFPDPNVARNKYIVGEPYQVTYSVWPLVFSCKHKNCSAIQYYTDIDSLKRRNPTLKCYRCNANESLRQVSYCFVHECGRIETLYVPKCDKDEKHPIELVDRRSFRESYWKCQVCGTVLQKRSSDGLGRRNCSCSGGKLMRGIRLDDPQVYYSQTMSMVNVEPSSLNRWKGNARFGTLIAGAILGLDVYRPAHIRDLAGLKLGNGALSPELEAMKDALIRDGMPRDKAEAFARNALEQTYGAPWGDYDRELAPYLSLVGDLNIEES